MLNNEGHPKHLMALGKIKHYIRSYIIILVSLAMGTECNTEVSVNWFSNRDKICSSTFVYSVESWGWKKKFAAEKCYLKRNVVAAADHDWLSTLLWGDAVSTSRLSYPP